MKNILILILALGLTSKIYAQTSQTQKGRIIIEANSTIGSIGGIYGGGGTNFLYTSVDEVTIWNMGGEFGHFVSDNFAVKAGLGYGDYDGSTIVSYKIGGKYYAGGKFPIQIDYSGQSSDDFFGNEKPSYLGLQGGAAFYLGDMVSVEPTIRYNLSMNSDFFEDIFQIQIGFSIFL